MIRHACHADIPGLIDLCKKAQQESPAWSGIDYNQEMAESNLRAMALSPHHLVLVMERDSRLVGVLVGAVIPSWWHSGLEATDMLFYVEPASRGRGIAMLDKFIHWAFGFPTMRKVFLSVSFGGQDGERTEKIYSQKYARSGAIYQINRGDI